MSRTRLRGRIQAVLAVALAVIGLAAAPAPVAQADEAKVVIGAGMPWGHGTQFANGSIEVGDHCTIAAVGTDAAGRLVALTAGHCIKESVAPYPLLDGFYVGDVRIGTWKTYYQQTRPSGYLWGYYDFAFAELDPSKVTIASQQGANISAGLPAASELINTFSQVCLSGRTSGKICGGYVGNGGTTPREHITTVAAQPGDSGSPLYTSSGKLLGVVSQGGSGVGSFAGDVRDLSAYALAQGWVGGGFTPIG